ncbi:MAG: DUF3800 domain-containing protein [Methanobrevibacter sp.]|nr:DUF3800 domain-containing protein [Methanobrevibacter sp.]
MIFIKSYLFLDESGDLGFNGSKYFVISILEVDSLKDSKKLEKLINKMKRQKFNKELKNFNELKAYKLSDKMKIYLLTNLRNFNINSYSLVINKNVFSNSNKINSDNVNYVYMDFICNLISRININYPINMSLDNFVLEKHKNKFKNKILEELNDFKRNSEISFISSQSSKQIQIVDLIAWSIFQKFENNNLKYINLLNKNHKIFRYNY